ncbi:unnamed protein product [Caenorhabditis brenneri]
MESTKETVPKERKEKSAPIPENAALLLVSLFIKDEAKYNARVVGGSKKGKTPRQACLESWREDLIAIGCDRTVEQIYAKIRGDIIHVRGILTDEKAERGKTGGGVAKKSPKLDLGRQKLYEHFSGSHVVEGIKGGIESGSPPVSETTEGNGMSSNESEKSSSDSILVDFEIEKPKDVPSTSNAKIPGNKKEKFADFVKVRKRQAPVNASGEIGELRTKLLKVELELAQKKIRIADEKYENVLRMAAIAKVELETAEINNKIAKAQAAKLGIPI